MRTVTAKRYRANKRKKKNGAQHYQFSIQKNYQHSYGGDIQTFARIHYTLSANGKKLLT